MIFPKRTIFRLKHWMNKMSLIKEVSDKLLQNAKHKFPIQTPITKEYYYRNIFSHFFCSSEIANKLIHQRSIYDSLNWSCENK